MPHKRKVQNDTKVDLIGGGIVSMAASAFLIRDAGLQGHNIVILEESDRIGGSLESIVTADGFACLIALKTVRPSPAPGI